MKKIGLIINPIAGLGGSVGLKGSDGLNTVEKAIKLGAIPQAEDRALVALESITPLKDQYILLTCPERMGERCAERAGIPTVLINTQKRIPASDLCGTSGQDTIAAAKEMLAQSCDIILFAGGDGTARNVCDAVGDAIPVIGIPAGVKIHSAVYAKNPRNAGLLAAEFIQEKVTRLMDAEVMDIDEEAFREGQVSAKLFGYMKVPLSQTRLQGGKMASPSDSAATDGIARSIIEEMEKDVLYIIGPGSTTAAVMSKLELPNTLLGVDLVKNGEVIANDVTTNQIMRVLDCSGQAKIIVTPIGGQACLFGRGNQQISPQVIGRVGKDNIIIVATRAKLHSFYGNAMIADTGDTEFDKYLAGFYRVKVGYKQETVFALAF